MKMQLFYFMKYDLRGHWMSHKVTFFIYKWTFLATFFCLKSDPIKTLFECQSFIIGSMTSKVMEGHIRPHLC